MIYASTGIISASFSSLSSIGGMFTNLLPVFVGFGFGSLLWRYNGNFIRRYHNESDGICNAKQY